MNENIDLTEILAGCPVGTEFYHLVFGTVCFAGIEMDMIYPIKFTMPDNNNMSGVTSAGLSNIYYKGECVLVPSKDQRDWSKFERFWDKPKVERIDVNTFQPFDKILARNSNRENWTIEYYSYGKEVSFGNEDKYIQGLVYSWKYVIPYNEDTKHLIGTDNDCPEYYKWWKVESGFWGRNRI